MFFRTTEECRKIAQTRGFKGDPSAEGLKTLTVAPQAVQVSFANRTVTSYTLATRLASWFGPTRHCLLWITEFGIWDENLHLYYRLRQSYGDYRALFEAPGHMFLSHEEADLVTFLDLAVQFGWGGFLFGTPNESYLTISHDEWVLFESSCDLDQIVRYAEQIGLTYKKIDREVGE